MSFVANYFGGRKVSGLALGLLAVISLAASARADFDYYWDANGKTNLAGSATGTWGADSYLTDSYWGTNQCFGSPNRISLTFAAFGTTPWDEVGSYIVTVYQTQICNDIIFMHGTPTLRNGGLDKKSPYIGVLNEGQTATINSIITSAAGSSNGITKYAMGELVLGHTNTYRGPTTIEGGTLRLGAPQVLPPGSMLVLANGDTRTNGGYSDTPATFATGGFSQNMGQLSLTGPNADVARTLDFGSGASALKFADSSTQDWSGLRLTVLNFTPGVDTLRIGTNQNGLTQDQLNSIQFPDYSNIPAAMDTNGFVYPNVPFITSFKRIDPHTVQITWNSIPGRRYAVFFKTNLDDPDWQDFGTVINADDYSSSTTDTLDGSDHRFYVIELLPSAPPS